MAEVGSHDWLDEINLDPETPWLQMGTRALGDRPWLIVDAKRDEELRLKQQLLGARHGEVFAAEPGTEAAGHEVLDLVVDELAVTGITTRSTTNQTTELHPLDRAGRVVQEDLCLLRRDPHGWILVAASLCFPSRWRLATKMGRPLDDVHAPVAGYAEHLASRVDRLLDRLDTRIVWRRNWFIHPDGPLFQPDRPSYPEPTVEAARCLDELVVRSERQTLRRVEDRYALFTIRIQHCPVATLAVGDRRHGLARFLVEAPPDILAHRGLSPEQAVELRASLQR
ncbi:MAG: heme-dependent oxidative N-demethylase family protein [Acidimicrobiales bacterium]